MGKWRVLRVYVDGGMMQFDYLREFKHLCMCSRINFSAAAEDLHMTQPALSNHIQAIEKELGFEIIESGKGRPSTLTPAGRTLLDRVDELLDLYDDIKFACAVSQNRTTHPLKIRLPVFIGGSAELLTRKARAFKELNDDIELSIVTGKDSTSPTDELVAGEIDCCLRSFLNVPECSGDTAEGFDRVPFPQSCAEVLVWVDTTGPLGDEDPVPYAKLAHATIAVSNCDISREASRWVDDILGAMSENVRHATRYTESIDAFMLSDLRPTDVAFFPAQYRMHPGATLNANRSMRSLEPPLFTTPAAIFRRDDANEAAVRFKEFLRASADI